MNGCPSKPSGHTYLNIHVHELPEPEEPIKTFSPVTQTPLITRLSGVPQLGIINLTIGKFYRVNGNSTQHKGVIPDFNFPSIYPMDKIGEDTEPSALPFDMVKESNFKVVADLTDVKANLAKLHEQRMLTSVAYKVLQDDITEAKKRDGQTTITLNQAKLKAERDAVEAKSLSRLNELRAAIISGLDSISPSLYS